MGEGLSAGTAGMSLADGMKNADFTNRWLADDADIEDATASTYTLADAHEGKSMKLKSSFTNDADNTEALTSEATTPVGVQSSPNSPATGATTITGTAQIGNTLTVDITVISDDDRLKNATFTYRWVAGGTDIEDDSGARYTPACAGPELR